MNNSTFTLKMNREVFEKAETFKKILQEWESPTQKNKKSNETKLVNCDTEIKLQMYKLNRMVSSGTDHFLKLKISKVPGLTDDE